MDEPVNPDGPLQVLIVDDEPDLRFAVRKLLDHDHRFEVVGEASDGDEAVELARELQPDAALLDLMMPTSGREALPQIVRVSPATMVIVLSAVLDADSGSDATLRSLGAFNLYEKAVIAHLPDLLYQDAVAFRAAITGDDMVAPYAVGGRH